MRACIFAAVFFGLAYGINYLYRIFLDDGQGSEAVVAVSAEEPAAGQNVDITIQDEDLPADKDASAFFVGNNHQMLNPGDSTDDVVENRSVSLESAADAAPRAPMTEEAVGDISGNSDVETLEPLTDAPSEKAAAPVAKVEKPLPPQKEPEPEAEKPAAFVPMPLVQTASEVLTASGGGEVSAPKSANDMELDVLPDLEEMADVPAAAEVNVASPIIDDADFPVVDTEEAGVPVKKTGGKQFEGRQDVETMAKAISTLLKQEKD